MNGMLFNLVVVVRWLLCSPDSQHPRFELQHRRNWLIIGQAVDWGRVEQGPCSECGRKLHLGSHVSHHIFTASSNWALMGIRGGYHHSKDPRDHNCVRGFRQDRHAYKTLHIYSNDESTYYKRGAGQFGRRNGTTLVLSLECEDLA